MPLTGPSQAQPVVAGGDPSEQAGMYVYCVVCGDERLDSVPSGIEGQKVGTVAYKDLCALAHHCPAQPYRPGDAETVAACVLAHHRVVEAAWRRCGTVLPLTFNTVVRPEGQRTAGDNLLAWLAQEHASLRHKLDTLAGKAEYGIELLWDPAAVSKRVAELSPEVGRLEQEIRSMPRGLAYMYRQKLEATLKRAVEARATEQLKGLYSVAGRWADSVRVEKAKARSGEAVMLMNLSCLVAFDKGPGLEGELGTLNLPEGFSLRTAGPMPPYSFC